MVAVRILRVVPAVIVTVATQVDDIRVRTIVDPDTRQTLAYFDEMETVTLAPLGTDTPVRDATEEAVRRVAEETSDLLYRVVVTGCAAIGVGDAGLTGAWVVVGATGRAARSVEVVVVGVAMVVVVVVVGGTVVVGDVVVGAGTVVVVAASGATVVLVGTVVVGAVVVGAAVVVVAEAENVTPTVTSEATVTVQVDPVQPSTVHDVTLHPLAGLAVNTMVVPLS